MKIGYLMQDGVPDIRQKPLSGPAVHVVKIVRELQALGHQVTLLARFDSQIFTTDDLESFTPVLVKGIDRGPIRWFERIVRRIQHDFRMPYAALFESLRFASACRQEIPDCDLYYERMGWMGYGGGWRLIGLVSHSFWRSMETTYLSWKCLDWRLVACNALLSIWLMQQAVNRSSYIVATGNGWKQKFVEQWRVIPEKVSVIENGSEIVSLLDRDQLRCFMSEETASKPLTVVYVGAFEPWTGVPILLHAFAAAHVGEC